jgi:AraC family transcriptional regulator
MSESMSLAIIRARPGDRLPSHGRTDFYIVLPLWGHGIDVVVGSRHIELGGATGVAVSPLNVQGHVGTDPDPRSSMLAFRIDPDWLGRHSRLSPSSALPSALIYLDGTLNDTARSLAHEIESGRSNLISEMTVFLKQLIVLATDPLRRHRRVPSPSSPDFRVRRAMSIMGQHLEARVSFAKLACDAGLSRPHFFRLFHEQTSLTPRIYWNLLRIENALSCIQASESSICDLAFNLGFSSQSNFSRFFREHIGVSPICFRRRARQIVAMMIRSSPAIASPDYVAPGEPLALRLISDYRGTGEAPALLGESDVPIQDQTMWKTAHEPWC